MRSLQDFATILGKEKANQGADLSLSDRKQKNQQDQISFSPPKSSAQSRPDPDLSFCISGY